jgi:carbamoyl-phosphate synthase large subunit
LWAIAEALRRDWEVDRVYKLCKVDKWFLRKMVKLIAIEKELATAQASGVDLEDLIYRAFMIGFPSPSILDIAKTNDESFNSKLKAVIDGLKVKPVFKMVDTCAGEFESRTPYYYGTFESQDDVVRV